MSEFSENYLGTDPSFDYAMHELEYRESRKCSRCGKKEKHGVLGTDISPGGFERSLLICKCGKVRVRFMKNGYHYGDQELDEETREWYTPEEQIEVYKRRNYDD